LAGVAGALATLALPLRTNANQQNTKQRNVSVFDFGATGDGVKDDTAAIQAAINQSAVVYLPAGTFRCGAPLLIKKSDLRFYGEGELLFDHDFNGGAITIAAHVSNIILDGFTIRLLRNVKGLPFCGIYTIPNHASVVESRFTALKIYGAAFGINIDGGILSNPSSEIAANAFAATGNRQSPYMGAARDGRNLLSGNVIKNTLFEKRIGSGGAHGIFVRGSGYNIISDNRIENMQGGILAASNGMVSNNLILNCFEDNGIYCAGSVGLTVMGNFIENTKADGIAFNHAVNCLAIGNQVSGAGNASFRLQSSNSIVISENICTSKTVSGSFVRSFIDANSPDAPYDIQIVNNLFEGVTRGNPFAFGAPPLGTPYRNWQIRNNQLVGVDTSGLKKPFYGPYAILIFGQHSDNSNLVVENNLFSEVARCVDANAECRFIRNATREVGNVIEYVRR